MEKAYSKWYKDAKNTGKVYYNELSKPVITNILHANIQYIIPAVLPNPPRPAIDNIPTSNDQEDKVIKEVADMLRGTLEQEIDNAALDTVISDAIKEAAIYGRGVIRVLFRKEEQKLAYGDRVDPQDSLQFQSVHWNRFFSGPAESFEKWPWIAFKHEIHKDELEQYTDKEYKLDLSTSGDMMSESLDSDVDDMKDYFTVWEVWDKINKEVLWILDKTMEVIKAEPDPLELPYFYPISRPIMMNKKLGTMEPKCPYSIYRDLQMRLNKIGAKKSKLIDGICLKYFGPAESESFKQFIASKQDGYWADSNFADNLNAEGAQFQNIVLTWPYQDQANLLDVLSKEEQIVIDMIHEIAGISDLQRGNTDSREGVGTQLLKSIYGNLRLQDLQRNVQWAIRDVFQVSGDIIHRSYQPETIERKSGRTLDIENDPLADAIVQYLSNPDMTRFRIDIESQSLKFIDEEMSLQKVDRLKVLIQEMNQSLNEAPDPRSALATLDFYQSIFDTMMLPREVKRRMDESNDLRRETLQQQVDELSDPEVAAERAQEAQAQAEQSDPALRKVKLDEQTAALDMELKQTEIAAKQEEQQFNREKFQIEMDIKKQELVNAESIANMQNTQAIKANELKERELDQAKENNEALIFMENKKVDADVQTKREDMAIKQEDLQMRQKVTMEEIKLKRESLKQKQQTGSTSYDDVEIDLERGNR